MTLREFIKRNRAEIDQCISVAMGCLVEDMPHRNDKERQMWVENDEALAVWAINEGVRI